MTVEHALMSLCLLALSVGGWFFRDMRGAVRELAASVASLVTEIAVMGAERRATDDKCEDHEQRIRALEQSGSTA